MSTSSGHHHRLLALGLLAALLAIPMSAAAADRYYLINDGTRWSSGSGTPLGGVERSPGSICKENGACYGLIFARRSGWHDELRLPAATLKQRQVELDPVTGAKLYRAAQRGYWRMLSDH